MIPKVKLSLLILGVLGFGLFIGYLIYFQPSSSQSPPWLFKGAFAAYTGKTTVPGGFIPVSIELTMRFEILEFNSTHAKVMGTIRLQTPFGPVENSTISWFDLKKKFLNLASYDFTRKYEGEMFIESMGTRRYTAYEYQNVNGTATFYFDKDLNWPIRIGIGPKESQFPAMNLDVSDTNIPGLLIQKK